MEKLAIHGGKPVREKKFPEWPFWNQDEIINIIEVIKSGKWGYNEGSKVKEFEKKFAEYHNARFGICMNSCTTGLKVALLSMGIGPGDEVILPAYTFFASASSIIETGASPVFVDINPYTYNIDPEKIEESITDKTKAVMPVHFAGRTAPMDKIMKIAEKHNLVVVEDAAQAWGSEWQGEKAGTFGNAGVFSFQSSKNITSAEGGIIITDDIKIAELSRAYINCGRMENKKWYEHYILGGNWRPTDFQGDILLAQLKKYPELKSLREKNGDYLTQLLKNIKGIEPLKKDENITSHSYHIFIFKYKKEFFNNKPKENFIKALNAEGIPASPGYSIPLYKQPVFQNNSFGPAGKKKNIGVNYNSYFLPETEKACKEEAVWFKQNLLLGTKNDMENIAEAIEKVKKLSSEI